MSITLILAILIIFLLIRWMKPSFLQFKKTIKEKPEGLLDIDDIYNVSKLEKEKELNELLDKIHLKGMNKLTIAEKERLKELSK